MLDAADTSRIIAVFDWEMATLGDPLTDIGYAVLWWGSSHRPGDHPSQIVADLPGFPGTDELVERYAEVTGRDCSAVSWYVALAAFKLDVKIGSASCRERVCPYVTISVVAGSL